MGRGERLNANPEHEVTTWIIIRTRIFRKFVETTKGGTRKQRGKISERSATTELRKLARSVPESKARFSTYIFRNRSWPGIGSAVSTRVPFSRQVATVD